MGHPQVQLYLLRALSLQTLPGNSRDGRNTWRRLTCTVTAALRNAPPESHCTQVRWGAGARAASVFLGAPDAPKIHLYQATAFYISHLHSPLTFLLPVAASDVGRKQENEKRDFRLTGNIYSMLRRGKLDIQLPF